MNEKKIRFNWIMRSSGIILIIIVVLTKVISKLIDNGLFEINKSLYYINPTLTMFSLVIGFGLILISHQTLEKK